MYSDARAELAIRPSILGAGVQSQSPLTLRHAKMASELRMQGWPGEARQIQGDPQLVVGTIWLLHIQVDTSGTQTVVHRQRQTREYN